MEWTGQSTLTTSTMTHRGERWAAGAKASRQTELQFIEGAGVWKVVLRVPVIRGRWVAIHKGDEVSKSYRSRYVAKEIRRGPKGSPSSLQDNAAAELSKVFVGIGVRGQILSPERWVEKVVKNPMCPVQ